MAGQSDQPTATCSKRTSLFPLNTRKSNSEEISEHIIHMNISNMQDSLSSKHCNADSFKQGSVTSSEIYADVHPKKKATQWH